MRVFYNWTNWTIWTNLDRWNIRKQDNRGILTEYTRIKTGIPNFLTWDRILWSRICEICSKQFEGFCFARTSVVICKMAWFRDALKTKTLLFWGLTCLNQAVWSRFWIQRGCLIFRFPNIGHFRPIFVHFSLEFFAPDHEQPTHKTGMAPIWLFLHLVSTSIDEGPN